MKLEEADKFREALALHQQGQLGLAEILYQEILQTRPRHFEALHLLGIAAGQRGDPLTAVSLISQAIAVSPDQPAPYADRGVALQSLGRLEAALTSFDQALALQPYLPEALNNRGVILQALGRPEEALASYDRALALRSDFPEAHNNRGGALQILKRYSEALTSFDSALALQPSRQETCFCNRGDLLHQHLGRIEDALSSYDCALAIRPDYAEALRGRGLALRDLKRPVEAMASLERAMAIQPDFPYLFGLWLHIKLMASDWTGLNSAFQTIAAGIDAGKSIAPPFFALATPLSAAQQKRCAEICVRDKALGGAVLPGDRSRSVHGRIRLGYFSADFREHVVAYLTAGLFEMHDKSRFELIAFVFGPPAEDAMRDRIAASFDKFIDVRSKTDADVALLAREMEIDIAIDLMGLTVHNRIGIFAQRAAPLQVNFLGYPGTMGAAFIDYLIADATLIPQEHVCHYAEKVAYLPHTYQPNDTQRAIADQRFTRQEMRLPEQGFVFSCFSANWKITPDVFAIWMRLLVAVDGSVLWLGGTNPTAQENLRKAARAGGVSPDRLVFKARTTLLSDHLAQTRLADLFLDTFPFSAHTTASDALWAGLPVLTLLGETFAGRVAASLLRAVGLPELVAESARDYEALALELAIDGERLAALRQRLATNRFTEPLFDNALFTRHIETAYRTMWQRHQSGLAPDHFVVSP